MRGIILAGGRGTRLHPLTIGVSKHLLPLYDKPMIYYPLSMLMLAGIREILIISTPLDLPDYKRLFGRGPKWGLSFQYAEQINPEGLAEAFILGEEFISNEPVCLVLGDNFFYGHGLPEQLQIAAGLTDGAYIFAYPVRHPEYYGVVELDREGNAVSIEEKPGSPKSRFAIPGIYFFGQDVVEIARYLTPSPRGELEIADILNEYLSLGQITVQRLGRGVAWLDVGTNESRTLAATFIQTIQERQGFMIACPEEISYHMGYISLDQLQEIAESSGDNRYRDYLFEIVRESSQ